MACPTQLLSSTVLRPSGSPSIRKILIVLADIDYLIIFILISNEFNDSHSALSVESFKQRFSNDLYTYYREFEETTKSIISLMNVTDDEISTADSMIMNVANIPETQNSTDIEDVGFVSTQQKTIQKKGKLQIRKEQLANKRTFTVKTFINRFRHLFIKIISPAYNFVVAEENNEVV